MRYLGLDIGTSSAKMLLVDQAGKELQRGEFSYQPDSPQPGWSQIRPAVWAHALRRLLEDARESVGGDDVAIGVTGQMHTCIMLDANLSPVCPAILWNDNRAAEVASRLREQASGLNPSSYAARIVAPGCHASSVAWLHENRPADYARIAHVMTPKDYGVFLLTNKLGTDLCDLSTTALYDVPSSTWDEDMLRLSHARKEWYGPIHGSAQVVGPLTGEARALLGAGPGSMVVAGTGDNPALALALGLKPEGRPALSLGTSGVVIAMRPMGNFDGCGKHVLLSVDGQYVVDVVQGSVQMAGGSQLWWTRDVIGSPDPSIDQGLVREEALGRNPVLFYPHIAGDKTLYADPSMRGAFFGLGIETRRSDLTQAVLEGVCMAVRQLLEALYPSGLPHEIGASGGCTRSPLMMRMLASILGVAVTVKEATVTPAMGACLLARKGATGTWPALPQDSHAPRMTYRPDPAIEKRYERQYARFLALHDAVKAVPPS